MNTKLLRRVAKHISEEPRRYNQSTWCDKSDEAPCGAVACIAGWAVILGDKLNPRTVDHDRLFNEAMPRAIELLNISSGEAERLFCYPSLDEDRIDGWPMRFAKRFYAAKTLRGRASAAVARIEHFIKTKGAELKYRPALNLLSTSPIGLSAAKST